MMRGGQVTGVHNNVTGGDVRVRHGDTSSAIDHHVAGGCELATQGARGGNPRKGIADGGRVSAIQL